MEKTPQNKQAIKRKEKPRKKRKKIKKLLHCAKTLKSKFFHGC